MQRHTTGSHWPKGGKMKPLFFVMSLIVLLVAGCSSDTVLGPENDDQQLVPAQRCSVINGKLC
jgi:uncharacterized protein YcfL